MEWNKQNTKGLLLVVCGGIAFYCLLQNLGAVITVGGRLLGVIAPFLLGTSIAFILNVPMRAIERHLFVKRREMDRVRRPVALVLTLLAVLGVLTLAVCVIGPGVRVAALSLMEQVPSALERLEEQLLALESYLPLLRDYVLELDWESISQKALSLAKDWGGNILSTGSGLIGGVVSGMVTFVVGLIFSFYCLLQKEKLARQGRQVLYGLLPLSWADRVLEVLRLANRTFSGFLSGQCLEACILGCLFVVAMWLLRLPYALLVGVLIAVTALIPVVGAFIGCAVGALLICIADPIKALVFVVMFLILQQIEGNLIYPHVVGSSVGLPSIWVLAAVTIGGRLMGVLGMLVFIPLCSVLYALFRNYVKNSLKKKNIPEARWRDAPPN